jgi:hypothetical protein
MMKDDGLPSLPPTAREQSDRRKLMIAGLPGAAPTASRPAPAGYRWARADTFARPALRLPDETARESTARLANFSGSVVLLAEDCDRWSDGVNGIGPTATRSAIDARPVSLEVFQQELFTLGNPAAVEAGEPVPPDARNRDGTHRLMIVTGPGDDRPDDAPPRPYSGSSSGRIVRI